MSQQEIENLLNILETYSQGVLHSFESRIGWGSFPTSIAIPSYAPDGMVQVPSDYAEMTGVVSEYARHLHALRNAGVAYNAFAQSTVETNETDLLEAKQTTKSLFDISEVTYTSNNHKMLILFTKNLFITDIDQEEDLTKEQILLFLENHPLFKFFRIYETFKGYRVFYTYGPLPVNLKSLCLLAALKSDFKYQAYVSTSFRYAARLTSKHKRTESPVCRLVHPGLMPSDYGLQIVIKVHDSFTLPSVYKFYPDK
jgi:hypothetical protein